jgi:hypothetical protein
VDDTSRKVRVRRSERRFIRGSKVCGYLTSTGKGKCGSEKQKKTDALTSVFLKKHSASVGEPWASDY